MHFIIPVAGEGTRLRPLTHTVPKPLLYVAGKSILGHILENLRKLPLEKITIVHGVKGEAIIKFCKKYDYDFRFVYQEKRLGLGHAIYIGAKGLKGPTIVLLGDTIIEYDLKKLCKQTMNVLAVKKVAEPQRFGIVETKGCYVIDLKEKPKNPKSNLAIAGLYYFQHIENIVRSVTRLMEKGLKTRGEYQLTDALRYLLHKGEKFKILRIKNWFDCGTSAALIETNRHLLIKNHHFKKRKQTIVLRPVYIDDSAYIRNSIIGPNVSIGENVTIRNSVIKDSIINRKAIVENALLSESIIGEKAVVKSGYKKLSVSDSSSINLP